MSGRVIPIRPREPRRTGFIHVRRFPDGELVVEHESASGGSFGLLARFAPDELEQAVAAALDALPDYPPSRLGMVALPLALDDDGGRAA